MLGEKVTEHLASWGLLVPCERGLGGKLSEVLDMLNLRRRLDIPSEVVTLVGSTDREQLQQMTLAFE